jgi:hypothetical protein
MVDWENGEITSEPLSIIAADDPVTCAIYAQDNGLLELDGWRCFKAIANRQRKFERMVNQAKVRSFQTAPRYKYGYEISKNFEHAKKLDAQNGDTQWCDATALELAQLHEYELLTILQRDSRRFVPIWCLIASMTVITKREWLLTVT